MKNILKYLIVLFIAFSFVSATAYAEGETLKVYGQANLSIDSIDDGVDTDVYLSSNSSRLGFKGELDMDDFEAKIVYQIEAQMYMDETGNTFTYRDTYGGLKGVAGTFVAGIISTPFYMIGTGTQKSFVDQVGDYRNIASVGGAGFDQRTNNAIVYETPSMGGVKLRVHYVTEENGADTDILSGSVVFKMDNVKVGIAVEKHGEGLTSTTTTDATTGVTTTSNSKESEMGVRLTGSFKFAGFGIELLAQQLTDVGGVTGADRAMIGGSFTYTIGVNKLKASIFNADDIDTLNNSGAVMYGLGYELKVSDKSVIYLNYAVTDNDANASFGVTGGGHDEKVFAVRGETTTALSLGMRHKFG